MGAAWLRRGYRRTYPRRVRPARRRADAGCVCKTLAAILRNVDGRDDVFGLGLAARGFDAISWPPIRTGKAARFQ
jgi:hypothetical protein